MPLSDKQKSLAEKIDLWIKGIEKRGGGDDAILQEMLPYMTTFKQLMDTSTKQEMNLLTTQYPGFYRFAKLLENMARGFQRGAL